MNHSTSNADAEEHKTSSSRWLAFVDLEPLFPHGRMAVLMQNRNNNRGSCNNKINRVGKSPKKCSPDAASNLRKLKRILRDAFQKGIKPQRELASQSRPSTLVPQRGLSNVRLRPWADNDFGHLLISAAFPLSQFSQ